MFAAALADAGEAERRRLAVARAGALSHGLTLAHAHVRLNAAQLHNAARLRLGLDDPPSDRSRRRTLLAAMDEALAAAEPMPVDFGALIAEQASAVRLMMLVAQVAKHVDRHSKVRFLVAETESGYSLLAALWLARLCGAEAHVEISPLFETPDALEGRAAGDRGGAAFAALPRLRARHRPGVPAVRLLRLRALPRAVAGELPGRAGSSCGWWTR